MVLLRRLLGDALRRARLHQRRTLREVSAAARVSLGYLSEVERGQKEASSELLSAICDALDVRLADVLRDVSDALDISEFADGRPVPAGASVPLAAAAVPGDALPEPVLQPAGAAGGPASGPSYVFDGVGEHLVTASARLTPVTYAA